MLKNEVEKRLVSLLSIGALGITLLVTDRISTEPVNVGKMVLLTIIALGSFTLITKEIFRFAAADKIVSAAALIFLCASLVSILLSGNPLERGFYGVYGRNTGFLTYFSLVLILISTSYLSKQLGFTKIIRCLLIAGYCNIFLGLLTLNGFDVFKWDNPYEKLLGTFGNPDFLSAFMGICISVFAALFFGSNISRTYRTLILFSASASFFILLETGALQGLVVASLGILITLFFVLKFRFNNKLINAGYASIFVFTTGLAIFGTLQKGPLASVLYKTSVSLRGEYWQAGINMGMDRPLTGVGLDSYGTYYRVFRDESAIILPGLNTVTDTAHNVFIDIFASTGIIGLLAYITLTITVLFRALKTFRGQKSYDPLFTAIFVGWIGYQAQSVISINQIGLAIWGWLLGGAIIAYSKLGNDANVETKVEKIKPKFSKGKSVKKGEFQLQAGLLMTLYSAILVGVLIATPPFIADVQLRQAMKSNDKEKFFTIATKWPMDSTRTNYILTRSLPEGQEVTEEMIKLAVIAGKKFPEDYAAAYAIYQLSADGSDQRSRYKAKLHRLDPLNPEFAPK